jgi:hypothetical protein
MPLVLKIVGLLYTAAGITTGLVLERVVNRRQPLTEPFNIIVLSVSAGLVLWNIRMYMTAAEEYSPGAFLESYLTPLVASLCFLICLIGMFVA